MRIIRYLRAGEVEQSLQVLRDAAGRMAAMGQHAWRIDRQFEAEQRRAACSNHLVGGFENGAMACTMRLQPLDPLYWPDARLGEALYLHKLGVRRESASLGWPAELVRFAIEEASLRGIPELRLDTLDEGPLPALYERLGFAYFGLAPGRSQIILMKMPLPRKAAAGEAR
jgi:GNAT superfamily N-acetyltransferase